MAEIGTALHSEVQTNGQPVKRRAACDECRTKKLKCTGENPACSRCVRENIDCVYSPQKQMGRPKKRQRAEDEELDAPYMYAMRDEQPAWNTEHTTTSAKSGSNNSVYGQLTADNQFDLGGVESIFTSEGELQPWLVEQTQAWAEDILGDQDRSERAAALPALTPDSASESPPIHNLPLETWPNCDGTIDSANGNLRDGSMSLLLDPRHDSSNTGLPFMAMPRCACLSTMYLTLSSLQSMDESLLFPFALHPLREAMKNTINIVDCPECPTRFITGMQNVQIMGTVVVSIAERFGKILQWISAEAERAELAGEEKKFRLADLNTSTSHLHAGGLGCVAAFNLNLSPREWRSMCKKVVRAEVHGPADGNDCCVYLMGLTKRIEERQDRWHQSPPPADTPKDIYGVLVGPKRPLTNKKDHLCLKLIQYANAIVERMDWT